MKRTRGCPVSVYSGFSGYRRRLSRHEVLPSEGRPVAALICHVSDGDFNIAYHGEASFPFSARAYCSSVCAFVPHSILVLKVMLFELNISRNQIAPSSEEGGE